MDFSTYGVEEIKNTSGDTEELRFKIEGIMGIGKKGKTIIVIFISIIALVFSCFIIYLLPVFLFLILIIINNKTIFVTKESFLVKNSIPIFPKQEISILNLERMEVKRIESHKTNKNETTISANFELYAIFKNKPAKKIFSSMNFALVDQLDKKIENFLNIKDTSNKDQLDRIKKTNYQNKLESEYKKNIQLKQDGGSAQETITNKKNLKVDKPSRSFPFTVSSNLVNLKITHFYSKSGGSGFIMLLAGSVFTAIGTYIPFSERDEPPFAIIFALIGFPILISGLSNLFNKRYINVSQSKISYHTKPISVSKEKEILKSHIKNIEVDYSGQRNNGIRSYNVFVITKDGKKHKLIKNVFNELGLKDLANEITHHMSL